MRRVLIVDDEPGVRDGLRRNLRLRRASWEIALAEDGVAAVTACAAGRFDVALLDVSMPRMSGIEAARRIRSTAPQIALIILTGSSDLAAVLAAVNEAGVFRYFLKPCAIEVLIDGIEAGFARHDEVVERQLAMAAGESRDSTLGRAALEHLAAAAFELDGEGRVLHMSPRAARVVARADVLRVDGEQRLAACADGVALRRLVRDVARDGRSRALPLPRESGEAALTAVAVRGHSAGDARVLVFASDSAERAVPAAWALGALYGLSPAESRLVQEVVRGHSVDAAAAALGITENSARTYLKTIFAKTGVARQPELVRLALTSAAIYAPEE